jgi:hypothetical protein
MAKLSWNNIEEILDMDDDGESYTKLCKSSKPSDFYFTVKEDEDLDLYVCITPVVYFDTNECEFDQSLEIEHLLPEDFYEEMEGTYSVDRDCSVQEIEEELEALGFLRSEKFDDHMKEI